MHMNFLRNMNNKLKYIKGRNLEYRISLDTFVSYSRYDVKIISPNEFTQSATGIRFVRKIDDFSYLSVELDQSYENPF